jgi:hypothetical protein
MSARETLLDYFEEIGDSIEAGHALAVWLADPECRDALVSLLIEAGALEQAGYVNIEDPPSGPGIVVVVGREPVYRRVSGGTD